MGQRRFPAVTRLGAVGVVAALLGLACGDDGGSGSSTPSTALTTSTTSAAVDYTRPAAGHTAGTGFLVGTSADGAAVFIEEEDSQFLEPGCEGQPSPVLSRLALGDGKRELLATQALPLRGDAEKGPGSRVVFRDGCEGFLSALYVATETDDGHLRDVRRVPLVVEGRLTLSSVTWSVDGSALVGSDNSPRKSGKRVVRLDPETGATTELFALTNLDSDVFQVAEMADGSYAVATTGTIEIVGPTGEFRSKADGNGFAVSGDRRQLAVYGPGGLSLLSIDSPTPTVLVGPKADRQINSADFSPGALAVAFVSSGEDGEDNQLSVVTVSDRRVTLVAVPGRIGRPLFTGDGRAVVFNRFYPAPRFVPDVIVVGFG